MDRKQLEKALKAAEAKSKKLSEARMRLPAGTSRAQVTTANARWARAAEERERLQQAMTEMDRQELGHG